MKGTLERDILNQLASLLLSDEMKAVVAESEDLYGDYDLPDIEEVYVNEEDADKIKKSPCFLLKPNGWRNLKATSGGYIYEFAVIVCAFVHLVPAEGIPAACEKAATYLGCAMDLLFTNHSYERGYWTAARPDTPADLGDMLQEVLGEIGRSSCHQIVLEVPVDYS